jgi:hypothetical protein
METYFVLCDVVIELFNNIHFNLTLQKDKL